MNLNSSLYTEINSTLIIHWDVNVPIGPFKNKFSRIMFSNYDDVNIDISTTTYDKKYDKNWRGSRFNQSINLTNNLWMARLTFGHNFNKSIELANNSHLTHLKFGFHYNQSIELKHNYRLTYLEFGWDFNQSIILPNKLTHLTLGYAFSQSVDLPNIEYLKICYDDIRMIENLPDSLTTLILYFEFNLPLDNLPNSIELIELPFNYDKPIRNIPISLKKIKFDEYDYLNWFTNARPDVEIEYYN